MYEKYSVLFVDDEASILNSIRRGMIDEEFNCVFANSGKEALSILEEKKISVVVTDMRMPEMNGLDLLKIVEQKSPMTVKLVLSGYTQIPLLIATINQVDIFKFVAKPWELDDLISMVQKALDYYIIKEENANYKKILETQNKAYQNILKKIDTVIENSKISNRVIGLCGKRIVSFGANFTFPEFVRYKELLNSKEQVFDILSTSITNEKRFISTNNLSDVVSKSIINDFPDAKIKNNQGIDKINVDLKLFNSIIDILKSFFFEEFKLKGIYINIDSAENFIVTIISPNAVSAKNNNNKTVLEMKIEYILSVFEGALGIFGLDLNITITNNNLVAIIRADNSQDEQAEKS